MNQILNKTSWGIVDPPEPQKKPAMELRNPFDEMEVYRKYCEQQKQNRRHGQDPQPTWVGVGAMSIICMIVGFILGVGI